MDYKKLTKVSDDRQIVDLDADLVARWNEYCENNSYYDDMIYPMDEFDELMSGKSPWEIARMVFFGHDFNPNYDWFWFNGYGNLESSDYTNQYCPIDLDAIAEEDEDEDEEVDETEVEDSRRERKSLKKLKKIKDTKDGWYGTPLRMIWHGEWSDPELTDGEDTCNYYAVEDALWEEFKAETGSTNEDEFEEWMKSHSDDAMEFFYIACGRE